MTTIEFLILILIYFVPAILSYIAIRRDFLRRFTFIKPNIGDILWVIVPFANFIPALVLGAEAISSKIEKLSLSKSGRSVAQKFFKL